MLWNYFVTAVRNFSRHKLFSFINIAGLTVGLTCAIFIILFVRDEVSYDKWIPGTENLYRVEALFHLPGQKVLPSPSANFPIPDAMVAQIPEVKAGVHLEPYQLTVALGDRQFLDHVDIVSPNFFQVVQLPLIAGDRASLLRQPESAVISESMARKYFGTAPALGKTLLVGGKCEYGAGSLHKGCVIKEASVQVTGVMRDLPHNTQMTGDVFIPNTSAADPMSQKRKQDWLSNHGYGYVLLAPGADVKAVEAKTAALVDRNVDPKKIADIPLKGSQVLEPRLRPFRDVHLAGADFRGMTASGDWTMVYGFAAIGVLILLVACFNFTNLATARAMVRAQEISLRKVMGATRRQLVVQFLGESVLTAMIALALALGLSEVLLPAFDRLSGKSITLDYVSDWRLLLGLVAMAALAGLAAGIYPALVLSGFRPAAALRANTSRLSGSGLARTVLVVMQFAVSIGLGIAALVVFEQTSYARALNLGLAKDGVVIIEASGMPATSRQSFVHAIDADARMRGATHSSDIPFDQSQSNSVVQAPGQPANFLMRNIAVGPDFFPLYDISLLAGRTLTDTRAFDLFDVDGKPHNVMVNEAGAKRLGYTARGAVGKIFNDYDQTDGKLTLTPFTIVGVTSNFKIQGDRADVVPTYYMNDPGNETYISVRVPANDVAHALSAIDRAWHQFAPSVAIDRHFLNDDFEKQFETEEKQERVFTLFVGVAIVIAALGLFGLAAFSTQRRTREIGLRKAFGARTRDIVLLLLWQFSVPVLVANLIAWPVAYYYLRQWLDSYAYRISLSPLYFLGAGIAALVVAWVTVIMHAANVAKANPISALRYE